MCVFRLELHLVGGFDDDRRISHSLSLNILAAFHKQKEEIHLETCCITDMNDVIKEGIHRPVVYGIGVNTVKQGKNAQKKSTFRENGPSFTKLATGLHTLISLLRHFYILCSSILKHSDFNMTSLVCLSPQYLSTSPYAEPPHFVHHIKSTIQFLLEHPTADALFPDDQPQFYSRMEDGRWKRV
nr:protein N-terminal asparagine amidohydrolase [Danio rerio]|eukprot:XP_021333018.1 protein N-terminal asparagine amidohydrolase [Danio rerio]